MQQLLQLVAADSTSISTNTSDPLTTHCRIYIKLPLDSEDTTIKYECSKFWEIVRFRSSNLKSIKHFYIEYPTQACAISAINNLIILNSQQIEVHPAKLLHLPKNNQLGYPGKEQIPGDGSKSIEEKRTRIGIRTEVLQYFKNFKSYFWKMFRIRVFHQRRLLKLMVAAM